METTFTIQTGNPDSAIEAAEALCELARLWIRSGRARDEVKTELSEISIRLRAVQLNGRQVSTKVSVA